MDEIYVVEGIDAKSGEYQGHPFDNYYLHCLSVRKGSIAGSAGAKSFKIKKADWSIVCPGYKIEELYHKQIRPLNNGFQQLALIQVIK